MGSTIKTLYVVHHSHTDIGYTDLQERIIDGQAGYIRTVLSMLKNTQENEDFRWNCESYYCVEQFLKRATEEEKNDFFNYVKEGKIGFSGTYLNFNDLLDCEIYDKRLKEIVELFKTKDFTPKTAMFADINGIAMGQRDVMLDNGIEFLFTNIHTHHGMYPLYQNQMPFWWENAEGKKLLVWNGEHYNLGNALGIKPNRAANFMTQDYFGSDKDYTRPEEILHENLVNYINLCEENGYQYDFIISAVSGVFSDNAPPNTEILRVIQAYNKAHGDFIKLQMVSLQELYALIFDKIKDAPVYSGDMTDWWANGVGSTPYAVKHYKEAKKMYHLASRIDKDASHTHQELMRQAEDNLLLYAEHTWGHSATISNPYETMVLNLDMRKNSYASKAHENAALALNRIAEDKGDMMRYYNTSGKVRVLNPSKAEGKMPVEFYIENGQMKNVKVVEAAGKTEVPSQLSPHPRGVLISFTDEFTAYEEKEYIYEELPEKVTPVNTRRVYVGAERIQDIINDYIPETCMLPYQFENKWFVLSYGVGKGITKFVNKKTGENMLSEQGIPFFTPVHEITAVRSFDSDVCPAAGESLNSRERRSLGRNIRGKHAVATQGVLKQIQCLEKGDIFTILQFVYELPGTLHCNVIVKLYEDMPVIDFKLCTAKTLSEDIESIYMAIDLKLPERQIYLKKGKEAFRPGVDQLPGSCIEYYMSDDGVVYQSAKGSVLLETSDVPLVTMGELKHHAVKLCDGSVADNQREIFSWIMNNTWETNFKLDLSGFCEFKYSLKLTDETEPEACFHEMEEQSFRPHVFIIE